MVFDAKPEILNLFRNSAMISSIFLVSHLAKGSKRKFHSLVNESKRKRYEQTESDFKEEKLKKIKVNESKADNKFVS